MSTLQQIRDRVRTQTDLDVTDLPDATLDAYIREGLERTLAVERRWPFLQSSWTVSLPGTTSTATLDSTVASVSRVRSSDGYNVLQISQQLAEDTFEGTAPTGQPEFVSLWGSTLTFWPSNDGVDRTYTLRGYRKPVWSGVAGTELDGDAHLHVAVMHYAVALTYAQLEDPELEAAYMQRWSGIVDAHRRELMRPQHDEPLILNGGMGVESIPRNTVSWGI